MAQRQTFDFNPNIQMDLRGPRALEFIAHYLDRIDQTLERIAGSLESGAGNEPLRVELRGLVHSLNQRPQSPS